MRSIAILAIFIFWTGRLVGQTIEHISTATKSSYENKSYLVNNSLRILPGFTVNGSTAVNGKFYAASFVPELTGPSNFDFTRYDPNASFDVNWKNSEYATSYLVYLGTSPNPTYDSHNTFPNLNGISVTQSPASIDWDQCHFLYYSVRAVDSNGIKSDYAFYPDPIMIPPTNPTAGSLTTKLEVQLNWHHVDCNYFLVDIAYDSDFQNYVTGYQGKVVHKTYGGFYVVDNSVLDECETYYYRAKSTSGGNSSEYSETVSFDTYCPTSSRIGNRMDTSLDDKSETLIDIFPNPFDHTLNIKLEAVNLIDRISVMDISAKTVWFDKKVLNNQNGIRLDLNNLEQGVYLLVGYQGEQKLFSERIVKE